MNAKQCLEFLNWFDTLPSLKSVFLENSDVIALRSVSNAQKILLDTTVGLRLIERFDWLSDELFEIDAELTGLVRDTKRSERSEILRVATLKREQAAKKKPRLFLTKRAQWEHDTHLSKLERMTKDLEDEKSQRILMKERAKMRRLEYFESLNKLSFVDALKSCDRGVFRITQTGRVIRERLSIIGVEHCHGWSLRDMLTMGHLLGS